MSSPTAFQDTETNEKFQAYRTVSKGAVVSCVLGALALLGFVFPQLLVLAPVGFVAGLVAYQSLKTYPDELTGQPAALIGILLCCISFGGGSAYHTYVYATEVPEGFTRVAFDDLKAPYPKQMDFPPRAALELNGQQVFIKGYVYPGKQKENLKRFVLVPDLGTCCFGGDPPLTHMIEVTLEDPLRVDYSMRKRKLAGTLVVDPQVKPVSGMSGVYYQLAATHAQ